MAATLNATRSFTPWSTMQEGRTYPLARLMPLELVDLVTRHVASMVIQESYRRRAVHRLHFGHVHDDDWHTLRRRLHDLDILPAMYPFPGVRREWRREMASWSDLDSFRLLTLCEEARTTGLWGRPAPGVTVVR